MEGIFEHGTTYFIEVVAGMHDGIKSKAVYNATTKSFETEHFDVGAERCKATELTDDRIYSCNGCGQPMSFEEISYQNTDQGDDYCKDCHEAIMGDPESAAGLQED